MGLSFLEVLLLVLEDLVFLTRHALRGQSQVPQHISHHKHNELANARVDSVAVRVTHLDAADVLHKALNTRHRLSRHVLQVHLGALLLQEGVKLLDVVLDSARCFLEESIVLRVEDLGPARPLVDHGELFLGEEEKLECPNHPLILLLGVDPVLEVARDILQDLQ